MQGIGTIVILGLFVAVVVVGVLTVSLKLTPAEDNCSTTSSTASAATC